MAAPPAAFGFALHARRRAADRWVVYFALVLSGLELLVWLVLWGSLVLG